LRRKPEGDSFEEVGMNGGIILSLLERSEMGVCGLDRYGSG
jgi:hypothetical protein